MATTYNVRVTDTATHTATNTFSLTVNAAPPVQALTTVQAAASTALTTGSAATAFTPVTASGGTGTLRYALTGGTLPTGLLFSATTGQISGTPSAALAATVFTVTVTDETTPTAQTSSKTFTLMVNAAPTPTLTSISPNTGPAAGGTVVTITGANFTGVTGVTIGGAAATGVTFVSATSITAVTPAGSAGTASVMVTTPAGTNAANTLYTYVAGQTILFTSTAPTNATVGGPTYTPTATGGASGNAVVLTLDAASTGCALSSGVASFAATGVCKIDANQAGAASYATANQVQQSFAVNVAAPVAGTVSATVAYGSANNPIALSLSGGPAASVAVSATPSHGTTTNSGSTFTYTPATGYYGLDSFAYTATNSSGTSAPATVTVTISPPAAPTVAPLSASIPFNAAGTAVALTPVEIFTSVAIVTPPAHGAVTLSGSTASYTPTTGYFGTDSFTYTATVPGGTSAAATVTLTVANPPPPTATAKQITVTVTTTTANASGGGATIDLSSSVTNASGLIIVTPPAHGTATVQGFTILYTANPGYYGSDSFTYEAVGLPGSASGGGSAVLTFKAGVRGGEAQAVVLGVGAGVGSGSANSSVSAPAMVTIVIPAPTLTITPASLPPVHAAGYSQTITTAGGTAPYVYTVSAGALPSGMVLSTAGVLSGTPTGPGTFTFTVKSTDNSTGSGPFSATQAYSLVTALPGPVAAASFTVQLAAERSGSADLNQGASGGPFTGATMVSVSPVSAGTASISLTSTLPAPGGGTVISSDGPHYILTFKPALHFSGSATVTYTLSNAFGTSAPGTVVFQVAARLDPTLDPDVKGLIGAQTDTARRFGETQIENFDRRLESLHADGYGRSVNGINFGFSPDQGDPREAAMRAANGSWPDPFDPAALRLIPPGGPAATVTPQASSLKLNGEKAAAAADESDQTPKAPSNFALWSGGGVDFGLHESGQGRSGFHFTSGGISLGADYRFNEHLTVGAGAGYGQDESRIGSSGTKSNATNYVGAVYASYRPLKAFFLDGVFGYGQMSFDSRRFVTLDDTFAFGKRRGDETFISLTAGYEYQDRQLHLSPYGRLDAINGSLDAFTETESGGGYGALSFNNQRLSIVTSTLGVRGDYVLPVSYGVWSPYLRLEYKHDFESAGLASVQYADWLNGPTYSTAADPLDQNQIVVGLGAGLKTRTARLSFEYKGSIASQEEITRQFIGRIALSF